MEGGGGETVLRAVVRGRVQGVGYRAWTARRAGQHGLRGSVRNRRDGTVEGHLAGPAESVRAMLDEMRQGPTGALVEELLTEPASADDLPPGQGGFVLLPTTD